jgi:hypothetical protein
MAGIAIRNLRTLPHLLADCTLLLSRSSEAHPTYHISRFVRIRRSDHQLNDQAEQWDTTVISERALDRPRLVLAFRNRAEWSKKLKDERCYWNDIETTHFPAR